MKRGYTLTEILLTVAILIVLTTFMTMGIMSFSKKRILEFYERRVISALEEARIAALTKRYNTDWGVKFLDDRAVLFRGSTYSAATPGTEVIYILGPVRATTTAANQEIVFKKGTGIASSHGTTNFIYGNLTSYVIVRPSGVIEADLGAVTTSPQN